MIWRGFIILLASAMIAESASPAGDAWVVRDDGVVLRDADTGVAKAENRL